jgi:hypothetical protein
MIFRTAGVWRRGLPRRTTLMLMIRERARRPRSKLHDPSACLREAEAASLRRRQVGEDADTSPAKPGRSMKS